MRKIGKADPKIIGIVVVLVLALGGGGVFFKMQQEDKAISDFSWTANRLREQLKFVQTKDQLSILDSQFRQLNMDIGSAGLLFKKADSTRLLEEVSTSLSEARTRLGQ